MSVANTANTLGQLNQPHCDPRAETDNAMFYRPFDLEQASQFLSSSTDIDLLLVEIRGHDLGVLRPTDTAQ